MGNFEKEKLEIKIRARELLGMKPKNLLEIMREISPKDQEKAIVIFGSVARNMSPIYQKVSGVLVQIFPVFLTALDGNFSEDRVRFLAEFVITDGIIVR